MGRDIGIDSDVDMDIDTDSDMVVSMTSGPLRFQVPLGLICLSF